MTPEGTEVTTTAPISTDDITTPPDPDGRTKITATADGIPVTYDPPLTTVKDIMEGTATLTTTVDLVDDELVADDVVVDLE